MILAALFFAGMSVCIKFAAVHFGTMELVFYRGLIGTLFVLVLCRAQGVSLATRVPLMHAGRAIGGVTSLTTWFYAIAHLPLATAMTLNYMSAVWIAVFLTGGALLRGRGGQMQRQVPLLLAVLTGFAGVVLMLRPTIAQNQLGAGLVGLLSGLAAAFAYLQIGALGRAGEPESRTVFYLSIGATLTGALGMAFTSVTAWTWPQALWLIPVGVLAALGQLCLTRAYRQGANLVVANLQYSGIVFAALFGLVLFDDRIPLVGWVGMALIIASGIAATALRARALPPSPAKDH